MRFQILCDSFCDFTATENLSSVFHKIPVSATVNGVQFSDDHDFSQDAFLQAVQEMPSGLKLSLPDETAYLERFDAEADAIYVVTSAATISNQYEIASKAKRLFLQACPGKNIHVFNSRTIGVGELLIARRICHMERYGCSFEQIVARVEAEILKVNTFLLPGPGEYLRRYGIVKKSAAGIAPKGIYRVLPEGGSSRVGAALTARGAEKKLPILVAGEGGGKKRCFLAYCGCADHAKSVAAALRRQSGFSEIILVRAAMMSSLLLQKDGLTVAF